VRFVDDHIGMEWVILVFVDGMGPPLFPFG
jgi:hypothetical protein